jgi:hypothetical protein
MQTTEIRVRPVVRHVITRYTNDAVRGGSVETLGEFDNEAQAEQVAEAMRSVHWPKKFVIVQVTFEPETKAYYAESLDEANETAVKLTAETGGDWRIFSRNA